MPIYIFAERSELVLTWNLITLFVKVHIYANHTGQKHSCLVHFLPYNICQGKITSMCRVSMVQPCHPLLLWHLRQIDFNSFYFACHFPALFGRFLPVLSLMNSIFYIQIKLGSWKLLICSTHSENLKHNMSGVLPATAAPHFRMMHA